MKPLWHPLAAPLTPALWQEADSDVDQDLQEQGEACAACAAIAFVDVGPAVALAAGTKEADGSHGSGGGSSNAAASERLDATGLVSSSVEGTATAKLYGRAWHSRPRAL